MATVQLPGYNRRDSLDTILKGLQIAGGIYNIKGAMEKSDALAAQRAEQSKLAEQQIAKGEFEAREREMAEKGFTSPYQQTQLTRQGIQFVPEGTRGAISFGMTPDQKPLFALTPQSRQEQRLATKLASDEQKRISKATSDLRKEYTKLSDNSVGVLRNYKKVESAYRNPNPSGATDISMVFAFMKTIDPPSTVREGEVATAENSGGIPAQVRNFYNKILTGERLTPEQRENFYKEAREIAAGQMELQRFTDDRFRQLATKAGVDVDDVLDERFSEFMESLQKQRQEMLSEQPASMFDLVPTAIGQPPQRPQDKESVINKFLGE